MCTQALSGHAAVKTQSHNDAAYDNEEWWRSPKVMESDDDAPTP